MPRKKMSRSALQHAYELHDRHLVYFAASQIHDDVIRAKRIVREVFTDLSLNGGRLKNKTEIREYLYEKTSEACYKVLHEHEERVLMVSDVLYSGRMSETTREDGMIEAELLQELKDSLDTLPRNARFVIDLHFYHGMTTKDIAEFLNIAQQTVLNHKARALKMLRNQMLNSGFMCILMLLISI